MAKIEVDEAQFQEMQRVMTTLQKINSTPEGKRVLQKAHKLADPTAPTPDLDADEKKAATESEWQKKFTDLESKLKADEEKRTADAAIASTTAKLEAGRAKLRDQRYTPEGIEAVEKFMQERGIPDHEIAARYLESQNPPTPEPISSRAFGGFNFMEQPKEGDDFVKALMASKGDDDGAVLKQAVEAIGQVRGVSTRR